MSKSKSSLIIRNTLVLYFRMIVILLISMYTSRVVLNALGVVDFGIYNVVGGIVALFGFLNSAMANGTQRFLNFEMGRNDFPMLRKVFSMSLSIHILIALIILILAETVGLWFLNFKLNLPSERIVAANWVYQSTIFSAMISLTQVPYMASIIANEKMDVYGYVSFLEATLKLALVYILLLYNYDKLILYSILVLVVSIIVAFTYRIYCIRTFAETRYKFAWDSNLFKRLIGFTSWNLLGTLSSMLSNHGINIILNLFFGPTINAARGISVSINSALNSLVTNFQTAINPQITQNFAMEEHTAFQRLVFQSSKLSYYVLFMFSLPVIFEINPILKFWLKNPPDYSNIFCVLMITDSLIKGISGPLITAAYATGSIKRYQIIVSLVMLTKLPLSIVFLTISKNPVLVFVVSIMIDFIALFIRLILLRRMIKFNFGAFLSEVLFKIILITVISISFVYATYLALNNFHFRFIFTFIISFAIVLISSYLIGLNKLERDFVNSKISYLLKKITK